MSAIALLLSLALGGPVPSPAPQSPQWVFVGTYTNGASKGIYRMAFDPSSGTLSTPELAAESASPSFLAIHPSRRFLYAVNEVSKFEGKPAGSVSGFGLDPRSGTLTPLNLQSTGGAGPCHLAVHPGGKAVAVANYGGGSVASFPLGDDGRIGPAATFIQHEGASIDPGRQKEPHAHSINFDAAGRFAAAADLGLDRVFLYHFDPSGSTLVANDPPARKVAAGSGPRHFAFHPDGKHAYVINELKSTISVFEYNARLGQLAEVQTISTLPEGFAGKSYTAEVQVHPSGKFVYGSNRGHDSIAAFSVDLISGKLTPLGQTPSGGKTPRNFGIDPTGRYLLAANQDTGNVVAFAIDPSEGTLKPNGQSASVPMAVCVKFVTRAD